MQFALFMPFVHENFQLNFTFRRRKSANAMQNDVKVTLFVGAGVVRLG